MSDDELTRVRVEPASRERATAVLRAALSDAADRAVADGIPPAALIRYGEQRIAALRRIAPVDPTEQ